MTTYFDKYKDTFILNNTVLCYELVEYYVIKLDIELDTILYVNKILKLAYIKVIEIITISVIEYYAEVFFV